MTAIPKTIPKAVALLNDLSRTRYGDNVPVYSFSWHGNGRLGSPRVYFIHRADGSISPFLPAEVLFARGSRGHVLAKLHSAIHFAQSR